MQEMKSIEKLLFRILFSILIILNQVSFGQTKETVQTKPATKQATPQSTQTKPAQTTTKPKTATKPATQVKPKTTPSNTKTQQQGTKPAAPVTKPVVKDPTIVMIGKQKWAVANLDVSTFRNGDSIPEAKTNEEWVAAASAGKPAWCYYNNDKALGKKYGKLYNWFAVNDPRELAPAGWALPTDADWADLGDFLGGPMLAGKKMKSLSGWADGNNGTNDSGFNGLPGGYRRENGIFFNLGNIAIWWSATEGKAGNAIDYYLVLNFSINRTSNPKQRGESVRCIKK
jgi:uncharacterized protein (TIGR02145 family)